jgi:hypothetical protein
VVVVVGVVVVVVVVVAVVVVAVAVAVAVAVLVLSARSATVWPLLRRSLPNHPSTTATVCRSERRTWFQRG